MAANTKFKFDPAEDELGALRDKFEKLQSENEALQRQVKALKDRPPRPPAPPKSASQPKRSSIFMIVGALIVTARFVLYMIVEQYGSRAQTVGIGISIAFGIALAFTLVVWAMESWSTDGWPTAGTMIFLVVMFLIAISVFDPQLLETGVPGTAQKPGTAASILIASMLFAATRVPRLAMGWLLLFLHDPREAFER